MVKKVSLPLFEGETLALVGESGSGKTTLANTIMGLFKEYEGSLMLDGKDVSSRTEQFYKTVQMVFQNPHDSISHRYNVLQAIKEPLDIHGEFSEKQKEEMVQQIAIEVNLPRDKSFLEKYPHHLSGGEAQRVAIARALILNPRVLLADEPTASLDASIQAKIMRLLLDIQERRGLALLLITHDIALARKVSDRIAVMLNGEIVESAPAYLLLSQPFHPYTRALIQAAGVGLFKRAAGIGHCFSKTMVKEPPQGPLAAKHNGCSYAERCAYAVTRCFMERPLEDYPVKANTEHTVKCFFAGAEQ